MSFINRLLQPPEFKVRYMGSKARLARHIMPILESYRVNDNVYIEPFVGGGNMITHATGKRIGFDSNPYVIATLDALSKGWLPKPTYSEEEYRLHASLARNKDLSQSHITGWLGFACSWGGKFFGGFARGAGRDLCNEQYRLLLKQKGLYENIDFAQSDYRFMFNSIDHPKNAVIYCDPPYKDTTKYSDSFDHACFLDWAANIATPTIHVFVSEYNIDDSRFECVWEK